METPLANDQAYPHQFKQIVRTFSGDLLIETPNDELSQSLALKESQDEHKELVEESQIYQWQNLFVPEVELALV
jgi:hypothetical protein